MSHLSPSEFVDLSDGTLPAARAAHVNGCASCRAQAEIVRDALRLTDASAPVPEPSPLFWDQLSARVREAVAEPSPRSRFGFGLGFGGLQPIAAALVLAVLLFAPMFVARDARQRSASSAARAPMPAAAPDQSAEPPLDPSHAAEWAVLAAAAADLQLDEARDAGMVVPAAAVDRAVTQLTRDELSELGRLLQSELKRTSNGS